MAGVLRAGHEGPIQIWLPHQLDVGEIEVAGMRHGAPGKTGGGGAPAEGFEKRGVEVVLVAGEAGEESGKKAVAGKQDLRDVVMADKDITAHLSAEKINELFEPMAYQGVSQALIDRLLKSLDRK